LASAASVIKRPHLSAVCLLKNCAINFVHRVAALSAAEKRDSKELSSINQTFREISFLRQALLIQASPYDHFHPRLAAQLRAAGSEY
ncbi:hypothetical protein, partial [Ralstonia pseudosolanacearum]